MSRGFMQIQVISLTHLGISNYIIIKNSVKWIQDVKEEFL